MVAYEFEGKTTEEAIENASNKLNLPLEELNIDIIEPGSAGIFGLVGSKKAKIKAIAQFGRLIYKFNGTDQRRTRHGNILSGDITIIATQVAGSC